MAVISTLAQVVPFCGLEAVFFWWMYRYALSSTILEAYGLGISARKKDINKYIHDNFNKRYGVRLIQVDVSRLEDEDDGKAGAKRPGFSPATPASTLQDGAVRAVFAACTCSSVAMIVLLMCELGGVLAELARALLFVVTVDMLIILLTMVVPYLTISILIDESVVPTRKRTRVIAGVCYIVWFYVLHKFSDLSQTFTPASTYDTRSIIERKVNQVAIAGITTMAIFSGIGSAMTVSDHFKLVRRAVGRGGAAKKLISQNELNSVIQSYNHTAALATKRQNELDRMLVAHGGTVYNRNDSGGPSEPLGYNSGPPSLAGSPKKNRIGGILHKVQSFASISSLGFSQEQRDEQELASEISSLESLQSHIYDELTKKLLAFAAQEEGMKSTLVLVSLRSLMAGFAVYCVYRIAVVVLVRLPTRMVAAQSEGDDAPPSQDALAYTLAHLVQLFIGEHTIAETQLINQIALALSGGLFLCTFTSVLNTFRSFARFLPSFTKVSHRSKHHLKHLVIAELLGVYVISTGLLLRTNLPDNLSDQITRILSLSGSAVSAEKGITAGEIRFIDLWFDKIYGISCLATIILLWLRRMIHDDTVYDEESLVEDTDYKTL